MVLKFTSAALLGLFYYQIWAHLICSYNYFLLSKEYDRVASLDAEAWIKRFYQDYNWDKFSSLAWKNDWVRIVFFPWTFLAPQELLSVSV